MPRAGTVEDQTQQLPPRLRQSGYRCMSCLLVRAYKGCLPGVLFSNSRPLQDAPNLLVISDTKLSCPAASNLPLVLAGCSQCGACSQGQGRLPVGGAMLIPCRQRRCHTKTGGADCQKTRCMQGGGRARAQERFCRACTCVPPCPKASPGTHPLPPTCVLTMPAAMLSVDLLCRNMSAVAI